MEILGFSSCNHCSWLSEPQVYILHLLSLMFIAQMNHVLTKKILKILILKIFFAENTQRMTKYNPNMWKLKMTPGIFQLNFLSFNLTKNQSKDSFEKLRTSRYQNCPWFRRFLKIWWRYCKKIKKKKFTWPPFSTSPQTIGELFSNFGEEWQPRLLQLQEMVRQLM